MAAYGSYWLMPLLSGNEGLMSQTTTNIVKKRSLEMPSTGWMMIASR